MRLFFKQGFQESPAGVALIQAIHNYCERHIRLHFLLQVPTRMTEDTSAMPPLKKAKFCATAQQIGDGQMHRQWWLSASASHAWSSGAANEPQDDLARYLFWNEKLLIEPTWCSVSARLCQTADAFLLMRSTGLRRNHRYALLSSCIIVAFQQLSERREWRYGDTLRLFWLGLGLLCWWITQTALLLGCCYPSSG